MASYTCNNCTTPIGKERFKCIACRDFDLCRECCMQEDLPQMGQYGHHHRTHILIRIQDEVSCESELGHCDVGAYISSQGSRTSTASSRNSHENHKLALKMKVLDALELLQFDITSISQHVNISYVTASQLVQEIFDDYYEFDDHEDSQKHDLKESGSRVSSAFAKPQPGRPIGQSIFANTDIPGETSTGNEHFPEIPVEMCWDMLQGLSECCTHPQDTDQQSINDTNDNNSSPINVSRDGSDGDESDDMSPDIGMNAADNHQKVLEYRMLQDMHALQLHDSKHAYRASALNQCCQLAEILQDNYPEMRARLQRFPLVGMNGTKKSQLALRNAMKQAIREQDHEKYELILIQSAQMYPHLQSLLCNHSDNTVALEDSEPDSNSDDASEEADAQDRNDDDDLAYMSINAINTTPVLPTSSSQPGSAGSSRGIGLLDSLRAHTSYNGRPMVTPGSLAAASTQQRLSTPTTPTVGNTAAALLNLSAHERAEEGDEFWPFTETEVEKHSPPAIVMAEELLRATSNVTVDSASEVEAVADANADDSTEPDNSMVIGTDSAFTLAANSALNTMGVLSELAPITEPVPIAVPVGTTDGAEKLSSSVDCEATTDTTSYTSSKQTETPAAVTMTMASSPAITTTDTRTTDEDSKPHCFQCNNTGDQNACKYSVKAKVSSSEEEKKEEEEEAEEADLPKTVTLQSPSTMALPQPVVTETVTVTEAKASVDHDNFHCSLCNFTPKGGIYQREYWQKHLRTQGHKDRQAGSLNSKQAQQSIANKTMLCYFQKGVTSRSLHPVDNTCSASSTASTLPLLTETQSQSQSESQPEPELLTDQPQSLFPELGSKSDRSPTSAVSEEENNKRRKLNEDQKPEGSNKEELATPLSAQAISVAGDTDTGTSKSTDDNITGSVHGAVTVTAAAVVKTPSPMQLPVSPPDGIYTGISSTSESSDCSLSDRYKHIGTKEFLY